MSEMSLRTLADQYDQIQRTRIAAENRVRAHYQGRDKTETAKLVASDEVVLLLQDAEHAAQKRMERELPKHPLYEWLMGIPGVNRTVACLLLGQIDIRRYTTGVMKRTKDDNGVVHEEPLLNADGSPVVENFSNLRTFCGLTPGKNKLVKGQKACFSMRLKKDTYNAFSSMLRIAGTISEKNRPQEMYSEIYERWRATYAHRYGSGDVKKKKDGKDADGNKYTASDKDAQAWNDKRQHLASKNKLLDVFLFHIWSEWIRALDFEPRDTYAREKLGHHMLYDPSKFSSPTFAKSKIKKHSKSAA